MTDQELQQMINGGEQAPVANLRTAPRQQTIDSILSTSPQKRPERPLSVQVPSSQSQTVNATENEPTAENKQLSYVDMYELMNPEKPETAEERARRMKKEKRDAIFSAIGDGISALSNLYFTTQYAPNAYDPTKGMSAKTRERWDKLKAEREANRRAYNEGYLRAVMLDRQQERDDRNWRHTIEREKIADQRYEIQAEREKALAGYDEEIKKQQAEAAKHKAAQEKAAAELAAEYERSRIERNNAAAGASKAQSAASIARAGYYNRDGGGGGSKGPKLELENETLHFENDKDYDRNVMRLAPDYGVETSTVEVTERDYKGDPVKQKTVQRDVKSIAADIEREASRRKAEKKKSKPTPIDLSISPVKHRLSTYDDRPPTQQKSATKSAKSSFSIH